MATLCAAAGVASFLTCLVIDRTLGCGSWPQRDSISLLLLLALVVAVLHLVNGPPASAVWHQVVARTGGGLVTTASFFGHIVPTPEVIYVAVFFGLSTRLCEIVDRRWCRRRTSSCRLKLPTVQLWIQPAAASALAALCASSHRAWASVWDGALAAAGTPSAVAPPAALPPPSAPAPPPTPPALHEGGPAADCRSQPDASEAPRGEGAAAEEAGDASEAWARAVAASDRAAAELLAGEETAKRAAEAKAAARALKAHRAAASAAGAAAAAGEGSRAAEPQADGAHEGGTAPPGEPSARLPPPPPPPPPTEGLAIASRVQSRFGWPCRLIGSSLFFSGRDVDLVLEVPAAASLADAYASVAARTGWRAVGADAITGQRVVSLHGDFEGHAIDAQVWRGETRASTPAEVGRDEPR